MLKKYVNGFCIDGEGVIEKNAQMGAKEINIFTHSPLQAQARMQKSGLKGSIIVTPKDYKRFEGKIQFPLKIFVDLNVEDEKTLEKISLKNLPVVLPLFDNLFATGQINAKYELSPAKFIEQMGFLDRDCTIIGGMYADKDDLMLLGQYKPLVVVCPRAHARRGGTTANITLMQKYGLRLAIGTMDEEVDFDREIEYLFLTNLSLLEDENAIAREEIEEIAKGERR